MRRVHKLSIALLAVLQCIVASSGDRAEIFQVCLTFCEASFCGQPYPMDRSLRLTRWTCLDDCKYRCMHEITNAAVEKMDMGDEHVRIEQYYGKWPFWRFLGAQEPASVLFSLLNLYAHVKGGNHLMRKLSC